MSHKLWSLPEDWQLPQGSFNKEGSIVSQPKKKDCDDKQDDEEPRPAPDKTASIYYTGLTKKGADEWLRKVQAPTINIFTYISITFTAGSVPNIHI